MNDIILDKGNHIPDLSSESMRNDTQTDAVFTILGMCKFGGTGHHQWHGSGGKVKQNTLIDGVGKMLVGFRDILGGDDYSNLEVEIEIKKT